MREPTDQKGDGPPAGAKYLGVGLTWIGSTVLFLLLGSFADRALGTKPVLTVVGMVIGIGTGFYALLRQVTRDAKASRGTGSK